MSEQTNLINVVNDEQYVDWPSLRYYDQRIKDYIRTTSATKEDQEQLRHDLEQLEKLLSTFAETFTADKNHILKHIEECKESSATKTELAAALEAIREEIKAISGVDLSAYATKEFVEEKIAEVDVELPEGLVTEDALQEYVAEEIAKIEHPDVSNFATKEELEAVQNVAGENSIKLFQLDSDLVDINNKLDTIPIKVSELENDTGYITADDIPDTVKIFTFKPLTPLGYTASFTNDLTDYHNYEGNKLLQIQLFDEVCIATVEESWSNTQTTDWWKTYTIRFLYQGTTPCEIVACENHDGSPYFDWKYTVSNVQNNKLVGKLASEQFVKDSIDAINIPDTDLSNYYNKAETENLIAEAVESIEHPTVDLEGYATEDWVNEQGFLKEHQDLSEYAKKSDIPEAELFVVDFTTPNFAAALEAHNNGKLLLLANAAPDANGYAVMNYVRADLITFTKFLTSRSEAYGSFNTYYLHSDNTWEISKEVKLNKVEANVDGEVNGELTSIRIGKEVYSIPSTEGFASIEYVNDTSKNLQTSITSITETTETLQTTVTQVQENVTQVSTQVTELEQNIQNNYITIENGVTRENLEEAVKTQVETEIEVIVDEKIAEVVEQGVTVSSIAYGEF